MTHMSTEYAGAATAPTDTETKDRLRLFLLSSPEGRRVIDLLAPGMPTTAEDPVPPRVDPPRPPRVAEADSVMPAWAKAYATWFALRGPCRTYAGQALQHFTVLIEDAGWKGQAAVGEIGSAISAELSTSAALKEAGEAAAKEARPDGGALQLEVRAYREAVEQLATAVHKAAEEARIHLVERARRMQKENVGAFHPELANGLVASKQCLLIITQILTALAPVTLGISAAVAAGVNLAASGIEALIIEAHVDEDQQTVIALTGMRIDADTEDLETLEKVHGRAEKVHQGVEQVLKHVGQLPVAEAVKGVAEVGEKVAGGVGTAFAFAGFYLDAQKYDTTRKVVAAASPDTMAKLKEAAGQVYSLHTAKVIREPVALLDLVEDAVMGPGVRILQAGGKEGVLYSSGIFIPSDSRYRFDIFLDRARALQDRGEQDQVRVDFAQPVVMLAEVGSDFTLRATVHASPAGWPDFADWYPLEGRLTPEGLLRGFRPDQVPPFSRVAARHRDQDGLGTGAYPDWAAACEVAARLNARAKAGDEAFYNDDRHPYWAITKVESKPYHDTGETVDVLVHLSGAPQPGDYNEWLDKVRVIQHGAEQEARAREPRTGDHRRDTSG